MKSVDTIATMRSSKALSIDARSCVIFGNVWGGIFARFNQPGLLLHVLYLGVNRQGGTGRMKYTNGIYFMKKYIWTLIGRKMIQIGVYINVGE